MEVRATRDLAQRSDGDLFTEVSVGMRLVAANVRRLYGAVHPLVNEGRLQPARVLAKIAEEEAAKFLILLDVIRCPKQPGERFSVQLQRFGDHLAKGLYAKSCGYRPVTLADLQGYINLDREQYYLDGPNGVDWIFRNEIIDSRESTFYVDFVRSDDGHHWTDPAQFEDLAATAPEPQAIRLVRCWDDVGVVAPDALATLADLWRGNPVDEQTDVRKIRALNSETLGRLNDRGLLREQAQDVYQWIHSEWQFPMYGLDLSMIRNDVAGLRERQRNWGPDGY
jgi:AbiV family abortive infection protein